MADTIIIILLLSFVFFALVWLLTIAILYITDDFKIFDIYELWEEEDE